MEQKKLKSIIEAILFTLGSAVEIKKLAEVAGVSIKEVNDAAAELEKKYAKEDSGVMMIHLEDSLQLCSFRP